MVRPVLGRDLQRHLTKHLLFLASAALRGTAVIATTKAASTIILAHALGGDELNIRMKNTPGINSLLAKPHEPNVSLCGLFACFGCCLATHPVSTLLSMHGVADLAGKHIRGAHAGSRARVTSMGSLYDTATLHEILLHLRWGSKSR